MICHLPLVHSLPVAPLTSIDERGQKQSGPAFFLVKIFHHAIYRYFHPLKPSVEAKLLMNRTPKKACFWLKIRKNTVSLAMVLLVSAGYAQLPWNENFGTQGCGSQGTLANGFGTANGVWNVIDVGANGLFPNDWFISSVVGGPTGPGSCVQNCINQPAVNNRTLHISINNPPDVDTGLNYNKTGFGIISNTNKRVQSPVINCTGQFAITLNFDFVHRSNATDRCFLEYFDGTTWITLQELPNTPLGCQPLGQWNNFSINLPASANNNPNVRVGWRWENSDTGAFTDFSISVAVDNVSITAGPAPTPPVAGFNVVGGVTTICEDNCLSFNSTTTFDATWSTGAANATYAWSFPGGTPSTSNLQNPVICYNNPGTYSVTLTVTDNIGASAPLTQNNLITILDCGPVISITSSATTGCANEDCITFTDLSTGNGLFSWQWTFTSANGQQVITSTEQNPTVCFTQVGAYTVTLQATDLDGTETQTFNNYIQMIDCTGPEVDFTANRLVICPGECIQFTDLSTSPFPIFGWFWQIPGGIAQGQEGTPGVSTLQNPLVCYQLPGTYPVTLTAIDQEGPSAITKTIFITVDPCTGPPQVGIGSSSTQICTGDCVDFFSQTLGLAQEFLWVFQGAVPQSLVSTERDPKVICYNNPGVFNVTLTVSNSNGQVDSKTFVGYITVNQCINPPVPRIRVSQPTVCAGQCVQYFNESTGLGISNLIWGFEGATITSSTEANPTVCYNTAGTYSVSLQAFGAGGDSTRIFQNVITVVNTPECRPSIQAFAPDTICAGGCANFAGLFTLADSVRWTFIGGNPFTSTARNPGLVCYATPGTYTVIVEAFNAAGPATPEIFSIFVGERPPLNAGNDVVINAGGTAVLTASLGGNPPIGTFTWQPFDLVDNFRLQTVRTSPLETTTFIVYYKEPGTCLADDTVRVIVNFVEAIGVPDAFSPNGDGVNDELRVLGQGIARMDFKVYNRYGQLVWHTRNQAEGWDGTQNGKALNPGTFVYVLEVLFVEGGFQKYTGNVTLVR
jgi:gliding motility-associated-like protein